MTTSPAVLTRWILVAGLALLGASAEIAEAADDLSMAGVVLDDAGKPVPSYVVRATPPAGVRRYGTDVPYAITDAKGRFTIEYLVPGRYRLFAGDSETHAKMDPLDARAGQQDVTIRVTRYRTIEGVANDAHGKPLAHMDVRVGRRPVYEGGHAVGETRGREALTRTTKTDAEGRFRIERYPSTEPVEIRVTLPKGPGARLGPLVVAGIVPGKQSLVLGAKSALSITGTVLGKGGVPVEGARIQSTVDGRRSGPSTATDEHGGFVLSPFVEGAKVRLRVTAAASADAIWLPAKPVEVLSGAKGVAFTLNPGHVLRGEVTGVKASDLRGYEIYAPGYHSMAKPHVFNGASTAFTLGPLPAGHLDLRIRRGRRSKQPLTLTGPRKRRTPVPCPGEPVTLEMAVAHNLPGRIAAPAGVGQIRVTFYDAWGRQQSADHALRAGQSFELRGVPAGPGQLFARSEDGRFMALLEGVSPTDEDVTLTMVSATSIVGHIENLPSEVRIGSVTARRGKLRYTARLAADGSFETPALPPGLWNLEFDVGIPLGGIVPTLHDVEAGTGDAVATWNAD